MFPLRASAPLREPLPKVTIMKLAEYDIEHKYNADVISSERITDESTTEVRHIILRVSDPTFHYFVGQSIAVLVPGPHAFGNEYHTRLYSIASAREGEGDHMTDLSICVRRCSYIDDVSGERYPGVASNYLCDLRAGDRIQIAGPFGRQFYPPRDPNSNILMIGIGTGIAPFRAFVRHIYEEHGHWQGKVRLFYGAKTGMDLLYMNNRNSDIASYYDKETFKAFEMLSARPSVDAPEEVERTLKDNADEVWSLLQDPKTYVYVSGLSRLEEQLDKVLADIAGSDEAWDQLKARMLEEHRWSTLFYE